ncbi:MAG: hypothetical protein OXQ31_27875 [Spirochaetaceae bacterium]|nr:hypothetical protein [Spirochaetaceae bacterium]
MTPAPRIKDGQQQTIWFAPHENTSTEWLALRPSNYRTVVERRFELIRSDRFMGLFERMQYKPRCVETWELEEAGGP